MIGMNTSESSNLTAYFKERTVNRVVITGHSNGIMYPMEKIDEKKMFLNNFSWFDRIRPFDALDVFFWRGKNEGEKLRVSKSNKEVPLPTLNRNKR